MKVGLYSFLLFFSYCFTNQTEEILQKHDIASAYVGICISDLELEKPLIEENSNKFFIPASCAKLFTTLGALEILGNDFQFQTRVFTNGSIANGVLDGDLYLCGGADPSFTSDSLDQLVMQIKNLGVNKVLGAVVIDPDLQEDVIYTPNREWDDFYWGYSQEVSFLCLDENNFVLSISPNEVVGKKASVLSDEKVAYHTFVSKVITVDPTEKTSLSIERNRSQKSITVSGQIARNSEPVLWKLSTCNPAEYAKKCFVQKLEDKDIRILEHNVTSPNSLFTKQLACVLSKPLKHLIKDLNKPSNNLYAEQLYLSLSKPGPTSLSFTSSRKVLDRCLDRLDIEATITNGSGGSRQNHVSPNSVVKLLTHAKKSSYNEVFIQSLPIAGVDGTLKNRFCDYKEFEIVAKTGTMGGVSALAGYAKTKANREVSFCIFINHGNKSAKILRKAIDEILTFHLQSL